MRRFLSPRWLLVHLLVAAAVAVMLGLAWWQIGRAQGGNALSIGYSLEWPVFAAFTIYFWIKAIRQDLQRNPLLAEPEPEEPDNPVARLAAERAQARQAARAADPETAEYNHYLAWLSANPHRQPSDYPGPPKLEKS
ncbi:hypothetical protein [Longispora albida]|uniref:hypothetical protein n=1 Tax=Longispora albida TaxID=203523 RepID=UPI0003774A40|nr:hypothetical protein [Longispora albida]